MGTREWPGGGTQEVTGEWAAAQREPRSVHITSYGNIIRSGALTV